MERELLHFDELVIIFVLFLTEDDCNFIFILPISILITIGHVATTRATAWTTAIIFHLLLILTTTTLRDLGSSIILVILLTVDRFTLIGWTLLFFKYRNRIDLPLNLILHLRLKIRLEFLFTFKDIILFISIRVRILILFSIVTRSVGIVRLSCLSLDIVLRLFLFGSMFKL